MGSVLEPMKVAYIDVQCGSLALNLLWDTECVPKEKTRS